MFTFADVVYLFANKFSGLRTGRFSLPRVFPRTFNRFSLRHKPSLRLIVNQRGSCKHRRLSLEKASICCSVQCGIRGAARNLLLRQQAENTDALVVGDNHLPIRDDWRPKSYALPESVSA